MSHSRLFFRRFFQFRLVWLFILTLLIATALALYTRARHRVTVCDNLYGLGCPVTRSGRLDESEFGDYCFHCKWAPLPKNEIQWTGIVPALLGTWETKGFTVFVNPAVLGGPVKANDKVLDLLLDLKGLDTIVICAGQNEDILSHPTVKPFVDRIRAERPTVRIVAQKFVLVG